MSATTTTYHLTVRDPEWPTGTRPIGGTEHNEDHARKMLAFWRENHPEMDLTLTRRTVTKEKIA